jgi:hypothetical protein
MDKGRDFVSLCEISSRFSLFFDFFAKKMPNQRPILLKGTDSAE